MPDPTTWRTDRQALRDWQQVAEDAQLRCIEIKRSFYKRYGESNVTTLRIRDDVEYREAAADRASAVEMVQMYASVCQTTMLERTVRLLSLLCDRNEG
jgi:hypothetical protein